MNTNETRAFITWDGEYLSMSDTIDRTLLLSVGRIEWASHGELRTNGLRANRRWRSTLSIADTEAAIRKLVESDGYRVTFFSSQAAAAALEARGAL